MAYSINTNTVVKSIINGDGSAIEQDFPLVGLKNNINSVTGNLKQDSNTLNNVIYDVSPNDGRVTFINKTIDNTFTAISSKIKIPENNTGSEKQYSVYIKYNGNISSNYVNIIQSSKSSSGTPEATEIIIELQGSVGCYPVECYLFKNQLSLLNENYFLSAFNMVPQRSSMNLYTSCTFIQFIDAGYTVKVNHGISAGLDDIKVDANEIVHIYAKYSQTSTDSGPFGYTYVGQYAVSSIKRVFNIYP